MERNDLRMENLKTMLLSELGLGYDFVPDRYIVQGLWDRAKTEEEFIEDFKFVYGSEEK